MNDDEPDYDDDETNVNKLMMNKASDDQNQSDDESLMHESYDERDDEIMT